MQLLVEQLERRTGELARWLELERTEPAELRLLGADADEALRPDFENQQAPLLAAGTPWHQPLNTTVWLRFALERPAHWPIADTALVAQRFGTTPLETSIGIGSSLQRMQGLLYLDGQAYHGLDQYHRLVYLPAGPRYELAASIWTGLVPLDWQPTPLFRLVRVDPDATALYHDLRVLANALRSLEVGHTARPSLERVAEAALLAIDWTRSGSQAFRDSLRRAHELVEHGLAQHKSAAYEPKLIAAGHAHIDCAWLWPIAQTREKAGRTWSTALRLMERYPDYRFLASTPLQYEMVKQRFPETFEGIRQRVREGRWETLGGMWVEADCNLPDGESLARQMLLGTRYFEHEFGVETKVVWLPDTFGFSWALPTLMAAAGLPYFVTHKLSWSQTNRIPHDTFRWRGPDGRDVLAHFLTMPDPNDLGRSTYNATLLPSTARAAWSRFQDRRLQDELLVAFGYGDGGGGPTIDMLEAGARLASMPGVPSVEMGSARGFFERLEQHLGEAAEVPVWDGELYLEYHRGTYTGQARQKLRNVRSQRLYHNAELYASLARALLGSAYPREELEAGWRLLLTNQFHDILPGSAISQVYVDAEADYQELAALGQQVLDEAVGALAGSIETDAESTVVFNPSPFVSADYLELPAGTTLRDGAGNDLAWQATSDGTSLVYCAGVPANGFAAFRTVAGAGHSGQSAVRATTNGIDSPFWQLELDDRGRIARLWDKQHARAVLADGQVGNRLVIFEDKPLHWDAWDIDAFFAAKSREVDDLEAIEVRESGPERAVIELRWRVGEGTRIVQRLCAYARVPRIDFVTRVDWHERQSLLKVAFPTTIRSRRATYEIQFGSIERPTHRNTSWEEAAFELPAQRWVDLSDAAYGVALLADCKHGYSVREQTLWLSLLKGAIEPDPQADVGEHQFTYSVLPHPAGLDQVCQAAYQLTRPLFARHTPAHAGRLAARGGPAAVDDPAVLIETVKWAEDQDALILRLYEAAGGARGATLRPGVPVAACHEVDLLERNGRALPTEPDGSVGLTFRAHEVKTLRFDLR